MTLTPQEEAFVRRLRRFCMTYAVDVRHVMESLCYESGAPKPEAKP